MKDVCEDSCDVKVVYGGSCGVKVVHGGSCDVFVAGAGIAGIMAAISAAETGASVVLSASGALFSGSSFYPGTWGLGLIGPEDESDEADLVQTILEVGCGMADEKLVRAFVSGIRPSIDYVRQLGVELKKAEDGSQKSFIPCFDHKHRAWNGILFDSAREVFSEKLEELSVKQLPNCELLDLIRTGNRVSGVAVKQEQQMVVWDCKSVVLATGGYGGVFANRLTTDDVCGVGQFLALKHGCSLVNMEFMQMMPGYLYPAGKTIFNERTFRYAVMKDAKGREISGEQGGFLEQELLEQRSGYGPFTAEKASREVDFAIVRAQKLSEEGVTVTYSDAMKENMPEFVRIYFDWLQEKKGLSVDDPIHIGMFAHAANGGIRIREDGSTEVEGLFACGEVTGGMHGADRIGGLSTANGLVFGRRAGKSAAEYAAAERAAAGFAMAEECSGWEKNEATGTVYRRGIFHVEELRSQLQKQMTESAMVIRREEGLREAERVMDSIAKQCRWIDTEDAEQIGAANRLVAQLHLSKAILLAERLRRESRGSHYREDYPEHSETLAQPILIRAERPGVKEGYYDLYGTFKSGSL